MCQAQESGELESRLERIRVASLGTSTRLHSVPSFVIPTGAPRS
jgi:hypothetical protein